MKRKNETKESKVDIPQFYESLTHDEKLELKRAVVRDYRCEIPMKGLFAYIVMIESLVFKTSYGINKHTFDSGKKYRGLNEHEWEEFMLFTIGEDKEGMNSYIGFLCQEAGLSDEDREICAVFNDFYYNAFCQEADDRSCED